MMSLGPWRGRGSRGWSGRVECIIEHRARGPRQASRRSYSPWRWACRRAPLLPDASARAPTPIAAAAISRGVILSAQGIDARLQYDGEFAGNVVSNAGLLTLGLHF